MIPKRDWVDMTWQDVATADARRWIAVLPVGAVEQHGPHLPLGVDSQIADAYLQRVRLILPDELPVTFLPLQAIGASAEHIAFPGTLSIGMATLTAVLGDIGDSLARAGIRKFVIVNSHGGNVPALEVVTRQLRLGHGMLAVAVSWSRFGYPEGLFSDDERTYGIHGGAIETSLMLAARPHAVREGAIARFGSAAQRMRTEFRWLSADRPAGFGWLAQDLNPSGAVGDATQATAAKGDAMLDCGARAFVDLLRDVDRFDPARLDGQPASPP